MNIGANVEKRHIIIAFIICALSFSLMYLNTEYKATVLVLLSISLWATGYIPLWLTAFIFYTLCSISKVASPDIIFSGLTSSATWLVLSGIILGAAIENTGLGNTIADRIAPMFVGSYTKTVFGTVLFALFMAFIMPSAISRVILIIPILDSLAKRLGYTKERNGYRAILMGGVLGTLFPSSAILPANTPNNILAGEAESLFGHAPTYIEYFILHFPVMGALKSIILAILLLILFKDKAPESYVKETKPMDSSQKLLFFVLIMTIVVWLTESFHHIGTTWVGMLSAIICVYPRSGIMETRSLAKLDMGPVFFIAGIISMGALAYSSGIAVDFTNMILHYVPLHKGATGYNYIVFSSISTVLGIIITMAGVPAVLTPMTHMLSSLSGWSNEAVYMTQVIGFSTIVLPFQAPPLLIGIQTGKLISKDMLIMCLSVCMLSILILWPLDYIWWQILGYI